MEIPSKFFSLSLALGICEWNLRGFLAFNAKICESIFGIEKIIVGICDEIRVADKNYWKILSGFLAGWHSSFANKPFLDDK